MSIHPGRSVVAAMAACMCILHATPPAHGQDTLSISARLLMQQPSGVVLRLNAGNEQITGVLVRVASGTVYLASPERVLPLRSVTDVWLQRRATGSGGKIGAAIGAPAGAALFGFGAWFLSGLCDDCDDFDTGDIFVATLAGAALGAASGYLFGAVIGSSVPTWERLTESSAPATVVAENPGRHVGLSAFSVTPAIARGTTGDVGVGIGASYLSQVSRHIAIGVEAAKYNVTAAQPVILAPCLPESPCVFSEDERVWSAGGLARIGIGAERRLEPYALVGLGVTDFGELTLGGYSAGLGLRYRPGTSRIAVSGEARWHSNFTNSGDDRQIGFHTVGIALSLLR